MALDLSFTNEEKIRVSVTPVTSTGRPAQLDGPVAFEVVLGTCTIEAIDATSAYIVSGDDPGDSSVLVSADADLGSGVQTIADTISCHVLGAMATNLGLNADTPVPK